MLICWMRWCRKCKCRRKRRDFIVRIMLWLLPHCLITLKRLWIDIWKYTLSIIDSMVFAYSLHLNLYMTMPEKFIIKIYRILVKKINMPFRTNMQLLLKVQKVPLILRHSFKGNLFPVPSKGNFISN